MWKEPTDTSTKLQGFRIHAIAIKEKTGIAPKPSQALWKSLFGKLIWKTGKMSLRLDLACKEQSGEIRSCLQEAMGSKPGLSDNL
mmetsp:Transcript_152314/g.280728  ORF Transcript_152314/g.280728 Transcript_152314/m.280728 type:complete len:85 (+) Transcript_152314:121-375(+)